ncbi:MAG: cupin domain-containing protein [Anaerolineales bacterium]|nr:cupin domain-containing protein [Anaerolineales bacterium]
MNQEDADVGQRIKDLRTQRGWTLRELAKNSGLSANAISLIERDENSPTVSSLSRLAQAFNVPISTFFQKDHDKTCVYVQKGQGIRIQNQDAELESLGFGMQTQQIEPFRMTIDPQTEVFGDSISHPGQEFVYCLSGRAEYSVEGETYQLDPGDSLLFDAASPHCWRNQRSEPATILLIFQAYRDRHLAQQLHLEV